ncbi:Coiled-coil and C2 domain-containing protein 1A [Lamellibrachia satsuma]|nr:Coiled-coil and C2 domain-containing protein 1A [Lamellibrachia satsuma]
MFGKKKQPPTRKGGGEALLKQMGLQDIESDLYGDVENDAELEAELAALQAEGNPTPRAQHQDVGRQAGVAAVTHLDSMVVSCLKDDDDSIDSDTDLDDPALLAELDDLASDDVPAVQAARSPLAPVAPQAAPSTLTTLEQRLSLYREALQKANDSKESSKLKRLQRGIKTLEGMLTQVKAGKSINEHDIPPEVAVTKSPQHTSDLSPRNVSQVSPAVLTPTLPTHGASPATDITTPVPMTTQGAIPKQPVTGVKRSMSPNKRRMSSSMKSTARTEGLQDEFNDHVFRTKASHIFFGGYRLWSTSLERDGLR